VSAGHGMNLIKPDYGNLNTVQRTRSNYALNFIIKTVAYD
jgi:hypothetical protein